MLITNCARCGQGIEKEKLEILNERRRDDMPLFRLIIKQPKKKDGFFSGQWEYHNVILCDECQEQLWNWIYTRG